MNKNLPVGHSSNVLIGRRLPAISLPCTTGINVDLTSLSGWSVVFIYPRTGNPNEPAPERLSEIPGARGCTPQACGFRDNRDQLADSGISNVFGLSTQVSAFQQELVERMSLNYPLLSDPNCKLASNLGLKTFNVEGQTFYARTTLIIHDGLVVKIFEDIQDPGANATEVLTWVAQTREA
ncbi:peroxiredoxin [Pseudomonas laurylsulfativorans]|uniref:peroxiredoxin n=1 Tax=Pseudomonas laurylsulfativorans TaxID=1943631 RepID=UPI0020A0548A|nr:peroxiredoxin [Pseudomonas laurylsulfativorans]MCP1415953.1 peroxiredoxin [Pseudomonas laurylsulfativorans]